MVKAIFSTMPCCGATSVKQTHRLHTNSSGETSPDVGMETTVLQVGCANMGRGGGVHLPFKCVFAFSPEVVHVGLEVQLEHVVLVDVLRL